MYCYSSQVWDFSQLQKYLSDHHGMASDWVANILTVRDKNTLPQAIINFIIIISKNYSVSCWHATTVCNKDYNTEWDILSYLDLTSCLTVHIM